MSRFRTLIVLGGLLCPFAGVSAQTAAPADAADPLALTGGTLVDGTGAPPLADAVVLIEDGRIACAGFRGRLRRATGRTANGSDGPLVDARAH